MDRRIGPALKLGLWRAAELIWGLITLACLVAAATAWFRLLAPRELDAPVPAADWSIMPLAPVDSTAADPDSVQPGDQTGLGPDAGDGDGSGSASDPISLDPARLGASELLIPSLGLRAAIGTAEVVAGQLQIPADPARTARWSGGGALDGAAGTVLIAGHVASQGRPGALHQLALIEPGARVWTTDRSGRLSLWQVTELYTRPAGDPHQELYDASGPRRLAIVTCGGRLSGGQYSVNVVVIARPAL
ncbi:MAG: class F sortase [Propionibacteriaceae bacterium]|jgi:hypothetical protein|nr:class F sortase [Propionibacteriaceae bacterium]